MTKKINHRYFRWLVGLINRRSDNTYNKLLEKLSETEFYWSVPNDDNRVEDGLKLRDIFMRKHDTFVPDFDKIPCSVLEMMIGLAQRMEDILTDPSKDDRTAEWFWEMVANLELGVFTDKNYRQVSRDTDIDKILTTFLARTYNRKGEGSLFPLARNSGKNLPKVEIWYQMQYYLDENYSD